VYACRDLERGMDRIEALLGVRPARGGRHPSYGTHNALVSIGAETYLEVIAPDPTVPRPDRGTPFGLDSVRGPRLVTWAVRVEGIAEAAAAAGLGEVARGARRTTDGTLLTWELTDPHAMPLGGAVPFLIRWGDTPHPAGAAPRAGTLVGFRIEHPDPGRVRAALALLRLDVEVTPASTGALVALVETDRGAVELR
jgi:hypothetical protein